MTTYNDVRKQAKALKQTHGVGVLLECIKKVCGDHATSLGQVMESQYDEFVRVAKERLSVTKDPYEKMAEELKDVKYESHARKLGINPVMTAPYGEQEVATDTTNQQVESLTMKPVDGKGCIEGIRVVDRASAQKLVEVLQRKWDLIDQQQVMQSLMEKMEERHGEEFNAFFEATVRQVMLATGLQQVKIDTSAILLSMAQGNPMRVREEPGFLIYELVEDNDA